MPAPISAPISTPISTPKLTEFYKIPSIDVYRFKGLGTTPELVVSSTQGVLNRKDTVAIKTYEAAMDVIKYYKNDYNRDSFDNANGTVRIIVGYEDSPGLPLNNAYWNTEDKTLYFGDGDGKLFSPLGTARDVMAHEFGHAVIDNEVKLTYRGQSGGIHESVSDVWATGVDGNLKIGEDVFTPDVPNDALRDLDNLHWNTVSDIKNTSYWDEPHAMGEPLSHAAVLASQSLGLDKVRKIWYTAITEDLKDHSGFTGFRQATEGAALRMYGTDARQSVRDAFKAVGIN